MNHKPSQHCEDSRTWPLHTTHERDMLYPGEVLETLRGGAQRLAASRANVSELNDVFTNKHLPFYHKLTSQQVTHAAQLTAVRHIRLAEKHKKHISQPDGVLSYDTLHSLLADIYTRTQMFIEYLRKTFVDRDVRTQDEKFLCLLRELAVYHTPTARHSERVAHWFPRVAHVAQHPNMVSEEQLADDQLRDAEFVALAHDIGKVAVPTRILDSPERPTLINRIILDEHSTTGAIIGHHALHFNQFMMAIAATYHEHWDGSGNPVGKVGTAIPYAARTLLVADAISAMEEHRNHQGPLRHSDIARELRQRAGVQFDPRVAEVAASMLDEGAIETTVDQHIKWATGHIIHRQ